LYICRMQMNSFLQPLRGILKSGLTKVTTFHLE
jgi:hypothetical protein